MMDKGIKQQWRETYAYMQRLRPHIERRARSVPGSNYPAKLAHEWNLMLIRNVLV